ncbi:MULTISPECIES: shikimate dehydrogenase family protein [Bradyrhizobium]|uniref:shikimate dehydrogenase family protein n=1 Tax=Bradyrhizobium TaxID=374 RepID=UPI00155F41C5|nr:MULTISPECIES: shikimate dehydrogenase [Bradyrhizobium]MDD1522139.1 shikimate dehydrogenase [Bradyrhizobium sp. WBAH30]MDD1541433.1 shikimate dehydrogenase [Bradyrhizobium sp. WBAH41]MDD1556943.1 shikimate dehydrogenase [Bradyrhizobium sp. WBAH23]MDD1564744.1 shikimate dehydrogenase [Bradyrhizobium sp. WBAH33]MDD1589703.1 shikimate dehydrogenase [Bradyrhizobium sp. WBAH42]
MIPAPTGATRLYVIVGDPIAQVRSPAGVSAAFAARGHDGLLVPVQVTPGDLPDFLSVAGRLKNLDGIVVTIPHKFACYQACASATARAHFLRTVNLMRRRPDGGWHGDMVDGLGFVGAARATGIDPKGMRALLVGAGGAGSAIALELLEAGVRELAIHDSLSERRDVLVGQLNRLGKAPVRVGSEDPAGFDFVANATPAGMKDGDPLPVDVARLVPSTYCGCVITKPEVSPFIAAARRIGCVTGTGTDMYQQHQSIMVDFLLGAEGT